MLPNKKCFFLLQWFSSLLRKHGRRICVNTQCLMCVLRMKAKNFREPLLKWAEKSVNDKKKLCDKNKLFSEKYKQSRSDELHLGLSVVFSWMLFAVRWGKKARKFRRKLDLTVVWAKTYKKINLINYTYKRDYSHFTSHTHKRQIINHWITKRQ